MDKYLIEGTLRHQNNLLKAKNKYGLEFYCKIINTKYFGDDEDIATLVCYDDETIILGKPRFSDNFTKEKYLVKLVDKNKSNLYSIEIINNSNYIIHKIKEYIPNELIQFKKHEITGDLQIHFPKYGAIMTVSDDDTWEQIKRHINKKISNQIDHECSICMTSETIKIRKVSCAKCASDWCIDCYINIFRINKGIIICPYCRFSYGNEFPDNMIEIGIQQILSTI